MDHEMTLQIHYRKLSIFGLLLLLSGSILISQPVGSIEKTAKNPKVQVLPLPTFGYEPETKSTIGAVSLFTLDLYQDSLTRTSNAKMEFTYTWNKQIILESELNYFLKEEKWIINGLFHYSKYPDFYYGVGPETKEEEKLLYHSNRTIIDFKVNKNLGNHYFAGLGLRYLNYQNINSDAINPYPELHETSVFGIKAAFFKDNRNKLLNTTNGALYLIETDYNFSDLNYLRFILDLRKYKTFLEKYTLAIRLYNSFNLNTPSFFDYSILGGDRFVRGYYYGRYRDRNLSTLQAEFRIPLFWRLGLAGIGGLSNIYPDLYSFGQRISTNIGGGIRFNADRKNNINLRFDYVLGSDGQYGFYIGFGESF